MSINRTCLHAFHIVASEGSFSRAAAAHYVSQPTLSAQVKELESRYSIKLFERYGGGVNLTQAGRSLFRITQQRFNRELEAERLLMAANAKTSGHLRIGADSPYLIFPFMAAFQRLYPEVTLKIDFGNSSQLLESLNARRHDLIVVPGIKPSKYIYCLPLQADRLIAFVNKDHAWAAKRSIRLADLGDQSIVLRETGSNTRSRFEAILEKSDIVLDKNKTLIIGSREGVCEAVAAGLGVGIVSESEFGHDRRLHPLTIRDVKIRHNEYIAGLESRKTDPVIKAFMETTSPRSST